MKIIILGAGQVGSSVASNLCNDANDITVVDTNMDCLHALQIRYDLQTVPGIASHPDTLVQAGAVDADIIIAVTNSDETNMIACQVAYTLFHTPTKIARIRGVEYLKHRELFAQEALPVDYLISPEHEVTTYIRRLIEYPGALQVLDFADGKLLMVAVRADRGRPMVSQPLRAFAKCLPGISMRVVALYRHDYAIIPQGDTVIEPDDEVFFIAAPQHISPIISTLHQLKRRYKRVFLAGGGHIGKRLALALEHDYQIKIIEHNPKRARYISEALNNTTVLLGDASDEDLLIEENIEDADIFCALTNADETNIISSMLAKKLGVNTTLALINRGSYVDLVRHQIIDIAISPSQATLSSLLAHVRKGDVVKVHSLRHGAAEAIEAIAHGDERSSKIVGRTVGELFLPPGTTIGAIVRAGKLCIIHHDTKILADDHLIMLVTDKKYVQEVEKLFQVGVIFL